MEVKIGGTLIGDGHPCAVVAEVGINANGSVAIARQLIEKAAEAGCWGVKFQKRTVDVVYTPKELAKERTGPFGSTNGDLKRGLEFDEHQYRAIKSHCEEWGLACFASCWDADAVVDVRMWIDPPCYKIASASLTDDQLLRTLRATGKPLILSTGMSTMAQIEHAVDILGLDDLIIMHCTSTYPSKPEELNLLCIERLRDRFAVPVGYSGHEVGLQTTLAAVTLGACMVERHITLDRSMFGSDQSASIEPQGFAKLVRDIREIEKAMGDGQKAVYDSELPIIDKLRRVVDCAP